MSLGDERSHTQIKWGPSGTKLVLNCKKGDYLPSLPTNGLKIAVNGQKLPKEIKNWDKLIELDQNRWFGKMDKNE